MPRTLLRTFAFLLLVGLVVGGTFLHWTINRIYVPQGYSLQLRYKGPLIFGARPSATGHFAKLNANGVQEIGILEQMPGPGRHFYCPIWWERNLMPDVIVKSGELGVVTSKLGDQLPSGFLVDGEIGNVKYNGTLRKVYGPGRYRINPYGYDFTVNQTTSVTNGGQSKQSGWVKIPAGYVGVVTNLSNNPTIGEKAGIQEKVLQPGIYLLNPKAQVVDISMVGFNEKSIVTTLQTDRAGHFLLDASGEPMVANDGTGITFPSADGFPIRIDFTVVWGIMPEQAPNMIARFGNREAVESKVIIPQINSICRVEGSSYGAAELLTGEQREEFQNRTTAAFTAALKEKNITLLNGLVRGIYIPQQIREPIQKANLANELKLTADQQELTAKTEANLREAEKEVDLAVETVRVGTEKKVAMVHAEGMKTAAETKAKTLKLMAEVDKKTAELDRKATVALGEADGKAQKLMEEARAGKLKLAVEAFGNADAYNQWVFATGLPEDLKLHLFYAGPGTFWTDLKSFTEVGIGKQLGSPLPPQVK